jgi:hypothetical protein
MYHEIHRMNRQGFSKSKISQYLVDGTFSGFLRRNIQNSLQLCDVGSPEASFTTNKADLTLRLMPDGRVFDKTNTSFETEWYWHSEGAGGRMADDSDWDYSSYLNNWDGVIDALRGSIGRKALDFRHT